VVIRCQPIPGNKINTAELRLRFFVDPFFLWECRLHTLIYTLAFETKPQYLGLK